MTSPIQRNVSLLFLETLSTKGVSVVNCNKVIIVKKESHRWDGPRVSSRVAGVGREDRESLDPNIRGKSPFEENSSTTCKIPRLTELHMLSCQYSFPGDRCQDTRFLRCLSTVVFQSCVTEVLHSDVLPPFVYIIPTRVGGSGRHLGSVTSVGSK